MDTKRRAPLAKFPLPLTHTHNLQERTNLKQRERPVNICTRCFHTHNYYAINTMGGVKEIIARFEALHPTDTPAPIFKMGGKITELAAKETDTLMQPGPDPENKTKSIEASNKISHTEKLDLETEQAPTAPRHGVPMASQASNKVLAQADDTFNAPVQGPEPAPLYPLVDYLNWLGKDYLFGADHETVRPPYIPQGTRIAETGDLSRRRSCERQELRHARLPGLIQRLPGHLTTVFGGEELEGYGSGEG